MKHALPVDAKVLELVVNMLNVLVSKGEHFAVDQCVDDR